MRIWRVFLVGLVASLAGFVGGVWFVGTGLAFRWVKVPQVPPVSRGELNPVQGVGGARPTTTTKPRVVAIGVPDRGSSSGGSGGLGPPADRGDLLPTPGCDWEIQPTPFRIDQEWHKTNPERLLVGVPTVDPRTGQLRIVVTQTTRSKDEALPLRYVFFDAAGNRFPAQVTPRGYSSGGGGYVEFTHHDWDDLTPTNPPGIAYFGLERMMSPVVRQAGAAARAEAKQKGIDLLPPPRLGEPFDFDLPTADGGRVKSADLQGKVVLVVISGPFPTGPTGLQWIRKEYQASELAVVAISFEATFEQTESARKALGEPTSLVMIPNEPLTRRLWRDGAEIERIPAYWIIDPTGILRFRGQWFELGDRLATALGRPTRLQKIEATMKERRERARVEREARQKAPAHTPEPSPTPAHPGAAPRDASATGKKDQSF